MSASEIKIVNLSGKGISKAESRRAAKWMAKAFAEAPAKPALTIFFGPAAYAANVEMHECFWASHLNRVAASGILLGALQDGELRGFRCFFEPGKGRQPYVTDFRMDDNEDWDRFLKLAGEEKYMERVREWGRVTSETNEEIRLSTSDCFTTSIIVVDPQHQRSRIGHLLDEATKDIVREQHKSLFVRIHEYILPFYQFQGYKVLASPTYTLQGSDPFKVHFLMLERP